MGLRFIIDRDREKVALYDSTSGYAFGPVLGSEEEAEAFVRFAAAYAEELEWLSSDARSFSSPQLEEVYRAFLDDQARAEARAELPIGEGSSGSP